MGAEAFPKQIQAGSEAPGELVITAKTDPREPRASLGRPSESWVSADTPALMEPLDSLVSPAPAEPAAAAVRVASKASALHSAAAVAVAVAMVVGGLQALEAPVVEGASR